MAGPKPALSSKQRHPIERRRTGPGCGQSGCSCAAAPDGAPPLCLGADADPAVRDQFLRAVLLNLSEAVVAIDSRGTILFFSPGSEQLLGYNAGETIGRNVSMLMAGEDAARHDDHIRAHLQTGASHIIGRTRGVTAVSKSGARIAVDLRVVPLELGGARLYIGTMRDVRERVERELRLEAAKRQLAERNLQLRAILRSVGEGICLFDRQHKLITFNDRILALFAVGPDGIRKGQSLRDLVERNVPPIRGAADETDCRAQLLAQAQRHAEGAVKLEIEGGSILQVRLAPLPDGRLVMTVTDVTQEERRAEELRRALSSERAASEAKSQFLANMNHELRTPLNAILGMAEAILRGYCGEVGERQREYLRDIHGAGEHLRNLIGEILDLSKIESGNFKLLFERVAPAPLVRDCARMVERLAGDAGLRLQAEAAGSLGELVIDSRVMKQAVLNLLSNAIKFTPRGGMVTLRLGAGAFGGAKIEVADNGIGMDANEVATAMSVFGQVENVMNRKHSGTGLGLPLARAFVELHGGTLRIDSTPHAGTTVIIDLPPSCIA